MTPPEIIDTLAHAVRVSRQLTQNLEFARDGDPAFPAFKAEDHLRLAAENLSSLAAKMGSLSGRIS